MGYTKEKGVFLILFCLEFQKEKDTLFHKAFLVARGLPEYIQLSRLCFQGCWMYLESLWGTLKRKVSF